MLFELQQLAVTLYEHASENIIDISPKGIDKWNGLTKLGVIEGNILHLEMMRTMPRCF